MTCVHESKQLLHSSVYCHESVLRARSKPLNFPVSYVTGIGDFTEIDVMESKQNASFLSHVLL